ncbi:hypothetical protein KM043_009179 [Ampulex compressa]|nr:hypothetical protein KM043_009179 [Ampulex compressa]
MCRIKAARVNPREKGSTEKGGLNSRVESAEGAAPCPRWPPLPDTPCESRGILPAEFRAINEPLHPGGSPGATLQKKRTIKTVKLAPFKLRFSKSSKSRSEEKEGLDGQGDGEEKPMHQPDSNQTQLVANVKGEATTESGAPMVRHESAVPSSPPPSYEHVLEQVRMQQEVRAKKKDSAEEKDEGEEEKEEEKEGQKCGTGSNPGDDRQGGSRTCQKGPEILHKSSKEFYRAVAKQWGITCKMSDHCRCFDCQSHYFDCEYDKNEHQKTDGGLGAGTPMFISEGISTGVGCVLL